VQQHNAPDGPVQTFLVGFYQQIKALIKGFGLIQQALDAQVQALLIVCTFS
jgi:hypothetical protein